MTKLNISSFLQRNGAQGDPACLVARHKEESAEMVCWWRRQGTFFKGQGRVLLLKHFRSQKIDRNFRGKSKVFPTKSIIRFFFTAKRHPLLRTKQTTNTGEQINISGLKSFSAQDRSTRQNSICPKLWHKTMNLVRYSHLDHLKRSKLIYHLKNAGLEPIFLWTWALFRGTCSFLWRIIQTWGHIKPTHSYPIFGIPPT